MLTLKLVRLIEKHSEELVKGLTEKIQLSERTSDFRKIPAAELELAAAEVYRNLGEWLLQKTDKDIETRFRAIGARRATEGVGPHHFVWALITSRDHLWHFLQQQAFACNVVELYGELELHRMLTRFFDRAVYYGIQGYGASELHGAAGDVFNGALAVGLSEGFDLHAACRFSNRAAALSITRRGAQIAIPSRSEVNGFSSDAEC